VTERLYYAQPYLAEFDATVTGEASADGRSAVVLDRTAFYPTSGGQPHDRGTLNGFEVVDVVDRDDGEILHVVEDRLAPGDTVRGQIDWPRRFDHMQQHTGQHILSAALDRLHRAVTVSFHLGAEISTIDIDREIGEDAIRAAERESNRIVWENRPVHTRFVTEEEATALAFRKEPVRTGRLRVIDIEEFDLSACGGTHVARTGSVGIIAVTRAERFRGGLRIEFRCGGRALQSHQALKEAVDGCIRHVSVPPSELPDAIARLQAEMRDLRKTIKAQAERLARYEADAVAARGRPVGDAIIVVEAIEGRDAAGLKALALAVAGRPGYRVALFSDTSPYLVAVARAAGAGGDAGAVVRTLTGQFGGQGGGRPELAQGGGLEGRLDEILQAARTALGPA
jgi:alanyl-tRNA synthetase